jgi:hypothetical protein
VSARRGGPWREADGDFNPGWVLVILFALVAARAAWRLIDVVVAVGADGARLAAIAALLIVVCLFVFATAVYSLGRLKVLHGSSVLGGLAGALRRQPADAPPPVDPVRVPRPIDLEDRP